MSLHGPIRAQETCLDVLCSPALPAARAVVAGPLPQAPEPVEKFRRCKREKMQLSRTPAPTLSAAPPPQPDPWRWRPWPPRTLQRCGGGAALRAFPRLEEGARGFGAPHCGGGRQGRRTQPRLCAQSSPASACPRAPLCTSLLLGPRGHPTYPVVQMPGLGPGAGVTSG